MSGLRQTSKVLQNLGNLHIVTGTVTVTGGVYGITATNDPTLTIADGAGNPTITFGQAFTSAPVVVISQFGALVTAGNTNVEAIAAGSFSVFHYVDDGTPAAADHTNGDGFTFVAIGHRDN